MHKFYLKGVKYFLSSKNTNDVKFSCIKVPTFLNNFMFFFNFSKNISFLVKKNNYNNYKKASIRFLFQQKFKFFFKTKIFVSLFDSQQLLNRFNRFESSLNITNLIIKRRNIFISKKEHIFFKTLIRVLIICLRFKQIGLFSELVSNKLVTSQHSQWRFIRLLRKFLYYLNINTIYFLGIHLMLKGKFQRRRRKKRIHILK
jgi:hypothetical protein